MTPEQAQALRKEFPPSAIGKLPKAGTTLDYVGHAAVTDRLLEVDPEWTWEPVAWAANGTPLWTLDSNDAVMWIRLTVAGVTRLGVGICKGSAFELEKQLISDALRNAAMRFGVALDLWAKEDLQASKSAGAGEGPPPRQVDTRPPAPAPTSGAAPRIPAPETVGAPSPPPARTGAPTDLFVPPKATLDNYESRCIALAARGVDIFAARRPKKLPPLKQIVEEWQWLGWGILLDDLEVAADEADRVSA